MSPHEDEQRPGLRDVQTTLEVQRRRAAFCGWVFLILTLTLLLTALLFLPQGSFSSGEIQGTSGALWIKHVRGSAGFTLLGFLALQLFKQAIRFLDQARDKEKAQVRHLLWLKRAAENPTLALQAIQLIEKGSDAQIDDGEAKATSRKSVRRKKELPVSQD